MSIMPSVLRPGQKQWVVYHPKHEHVPDRAVRELLARPSAAAHELRDAQEATTGGLMMGCVQGPGEVLYLPAGYHHATVNLDASLAISLVRAQRFEHAVSTVKALFLAVFLTLQALNWCCRRRHSQLQLPKGRPPPGGTTSAATATAMATATATATAITAAASKKRA